MSKRCASCPVPLTFLTLLALSCAGVREAGGPPPARPTRAPPATELVLHLIPCGRVHVHDLDVFDREGALAGREADFAASCFLVRHPGGDLLWDTGIKSSFPAEGLRARAFTLFPSRPFPELLAEVGLSLEDVEWVGLSHSHGDHIGNIRPFVASRLLMQRAEVASLRRESSDSFVEPFAERGHLVELEGAHDVFGDGRVRILPAPGHTAGHQVLVLDLPQSGTVVIAGDLWHFEENRALRRIPRLNSDPAATLRSMEVIETLIAQTGARVILPHEVASVASLPAFPEPLR